MAQLILLRHLKSQWNLENRFSGWVDVPLCNEGIKKAKEVAQKIFKSKIDVAYSSPLLRNQNTFVRILDYIDNKYPIFIHLDEGRMKKWGNFKETHKNYLPVYISENLNKFGLIDSVVAIPRCVRNKIIHGNTPILYAWLYYITDHALLKSHHHWMISPNS